MRYIPRQERLCGNCDKILFLRPKEMAKNRFCSRRCEGTYASKHGTRRGKNNGHWKGGISKHSAGYVFITHGNDFGKLCHRAIMEGVLNRKLSPKEIVHHINGNKTDNRPENLELMTRAKHMEHHRHEWEHKRVGNAVKALKKRWREYNLARCKA